ncbi:MAG: Spy/CpxP family protein refolding chaperone [Candidatus Binatia bacterium]
MRKVWSFLGVGLLALSLGTVTVYGWPGGGWRGPKGGHGGSPGFFSPFLLKKLDLTDQQKTQVQQLRDAHRPTFEAIIGELRTLRTQIGDKFFAPGAVQSSDFSAQLEQAAELRQKLMQEGFAVALEIRAVLTPEQLAKADELRKKFQELHQEMREMHRDGL